MPVPASTTTAPSPSSGSSSSDEVSRRPVGTKPPLPRMRAAASIDCLLGGGGLDDRDGRARLDRLALLDGERLDHARLVGGDLVLHLHRLDDADELTLLDGLPLLDEHLPHVALQRRDQLVRAAAARAALALSTPGLA